MEKRYTAKINHKKAETALFISNKVDFRGKQLLGTMEYSIMTEGSLHQDIAILHVYASDKAVEYIRQTPVELGDVGRQMHKGAFSTLSLSK